MIIKKANPIVDFFWDPQGGPLENILGLVEYGYIFLGGWIGKAVTIVANLLGFGAKDLGRFLDEKLNLKTIDDVANISDTAHIDILDLQSDNMFTTSALDDTMYVMLERQPWAKMSKAEIQLLGFGKTALSRHQSGFVAKLLAPLLGVLKNMAGKIGVGGLASFLTLKGIQTYKKSKSGIDHIEDANKITERQIVTSKRELESAIRDALSN